MEEKKTYEEFRAGFAPGKGSKNKVRECWGVYDVYKAIRRKGWYNIGRPLKEKEFYAIIRGMNRLYAEEIANGNTVSFPCRMGKLELRKHRTGVRIVDDKLRVNYPVDWNKTLRLWYEDSEAYQNRTLLRNENPWVYKVKYSVEGSDANYENKSFYQFAVNTFVKRALSQNIRSGKVDTIW